MRWPTKALLAGLACGCLVISACSSSTSTSPNNNNSANNTSANNNTPIPKITLATTPIKVLDIGKDVFWPDVGITRLGMEGLTRLSNTGKVEPALASKVEQPDLSTYVYTLRKGVTFWDGNPLTPADVVASFQSYMKPASQLSRNFSVVASVEATGTDQVTVKLKAPNARWPFITAGSAPVVEASFLAAHPDDIGAPGVLSMGTGPFQFTKYVANQEIDMKANPNWWGGKVRVQELTFKIFTSVSAIPLALRSGSIDGYVSVGQDYSQFKDIPGMTLKASPGVIPFFIAINTTVAPWSDVHVRRAMAYLINDKEIINAAVGGYGSPLTTLLPDQVLNAATDAAGAKAFTASYTKYDYSVDKAKAELAKSAYPNGFSADWPVNSSNSSQVAVAQILKQEFAKVGIDISLKTMAPGAFLGMVYGPHDKITAYSSDYGGVSDPFYLYDLLMNPATADIVSANSASYKNPAVGAALKAAREAPTLPASIKALEPVAQALATDLPYIMMFTEDNGVVLKDGFSLPGLSPFWGTQAWAVGLQKS